MKNLKNYIAEAKKNNGSNEVDISKWSNGYESEDLSGYEVVKWPKSQLVLKKAGADENAWIINDDEGFEKYGSAAFVVSSDWWKGKKSEDENEDESDNKDESEDDDNENN